MPSVVRKGGASEHGTAAQHPDRRLPARSRPSAAAPARAAPRRQQPRPPGRAAPVPLPQHQIRHTRISGLWLAIGFFAVVLLFLLIFILQNGSKVSISFLGANGHMPLGVALLLSAVCGVLLIVLAGAARIAQLHSVARRHRRADARRARRRPRPPPEGPPARTNGPRDAARGLVQSAGGVHGVAQHDARHPGTLAVPGQRVYQHPRLQDRLG